MGRHYKRGYRRENYSVVLALFRLPITLLKIATNGKLPKPKALDLKL